MNKISNAAKAEIDMILAVAVGARHDYIPRRDTDFDDFQDGFMAVFTVRAPGWGVPPTVVTDLATLQTQWVNIWNVAKHKTTRTQTQVEQKDTTREAYEGLLRNAIQQWVYNNTVVTDFDIVELGLPVRDTTRTPSTLPVDAPELTLKPRDGNRLFIKFTLPAEGEGSSLKGLPRGVKLIEIVWDFEFNEASPGNFRFHDVAVKSSTEIQFQSGDQGKRIAIFARYVSTLGEKGPWSEVRFTIVP